MDSGEINRAVGGYILEHHPDLRVDVHEPQHRLNVEIRDKAYLYVRVVLPRWAVCLWVQTGVPRCCSLAALTALWQGG